MKTPQNSESPMYNDGHDLALKANQAFDELSIATRQKEVVNEAANIAGVEISAGTHQKLANQMADQAFKFNTYQNAAGALIGADMPLYESKVATESALTPEQHEKADKIVDALLEKFNLAPHEVGVVFVTGQDGEKHPVVAHIGDNGIPKGSWDDIQNAKAKDYSLKVNGKNVDTRAGMTGAVYEAIIADAKANGTTTLPDSETLAKENGEPWTATWLTGEQADGIDAPIADVGGDGSVGRRVVHRAGTWDNYRFRPAVPVN